MWKARDSLPCGKPVTTWLHWLTPPNIQEFGRIVTKLLVTNSTQTLPKIRRRKNTSWIILQGQYYLPQCQNQIKKAQANDRPRSLMNMDTNIFNKMLANGI